MSGKDTHGFDARLLDLHLGHLSGAQRDALCREIASDARLAEQDRALQTVFAALSAAQPAPMPADLAARSVARVRAAGPPPRVIRPADGLTEALERDAAGVIQLGRLREIVAIAAMIVFAIGVGVPGMLHMRERGARMGCSENLRQLGVGLQQYASTFGSSFPFAGFGSNANWQGRDVPGMVSVPNRRHVYPLLLEAYVRNPRVFVCPSQQHVPMPASEVPRHNDFLEDRNVSYAYQNMAGVRPSANDDPRLPLMSDENPFFDGGLALFDARRLLYDPGRYNSRAHRGAGENILTLGGEVKWVRSPLCGIDGDNIWTLQNVSEYTGREGPASPSDAHLIK